MAGRGPQSFQKRQKEQRRKEKRQEKIEKRLQRIKTEGGGLESMDGEPQAPFDDEPSAEDAFPGGSRRFGLNHIMEFVMTGFQQRQNVRLYAFEGVAAGHARVGYTVGVDLDSVRKFGIPVQELPLLCRRLLEGRVEEAPPADNSELMFTEHDMLGWANRRAEEKFEADQRRKSFKPRPPRQ